MMGKGIDVGQRRVSSLGKRVIRFALSGEAPSKVCVELGPGRGRLAIVLALLGFRCYLYDSDPSLAPHYARINACLGEYGDIKFHLMDVRDMGYGDLPEGVGLVVAERVLHHVRFREAVRILKVLRNRTLPGGRFFLSFSGLNSPIGEGYPDRDLPVEERWSPLPPDVGRRYDISGEVCLYTEEDVARLMEEVGGMRKVYLSTTAFGNVMAVYEKTPRRTAGRK